MGTVKAYRRLFPAFAALAAPIVCAFVLLVAFHHLEPLPAVFGAAGVIAATAVMLRAYASDLIGLERHARRFERGEEGAVPKLETAIGAEIAASLNRTTREWRARREDMNRLIGFYQALFDSLPSPLFLLNGQRRIVSANKAARTVFGAQVENRDLAAVLRTPQLLDAADGVLAGMPGTEVEFNAPLLDLEFRAMVEPLPKPGAEGAKAVLSLHDVTALRRMEQMRADFVANASHELRTPLSALLGFIETLQGPAKDDADARERFLAIMYDQASRMTRLVGDLLNLSRIELNEHSLPSGREDLAAILKRVAEGLEPTAKKRNMRLELEIAGGLPAVCGKEDELAQVFLNLADNALKYGREGSVVTVSATLAQNKPQGLAAERAIAVAVTDRGEGIAREHIPRLTERFFRVDTARSRQLGGTGLGLAIVKHIVNRHRGVLAIESVLGQGSVFTVFLPAAQDKIPGKSEEN